MKSLAELKAIKEKTQNDLAMRNAQNGIRIVVGMATCGIAAGARPVMTAFMDEIQKRNITHATVAMTGCIGMCRLEPIVEVIDKDGNKVTYVKMDPDKAIRVVTEHIVNGNVVTEYTIGAVQD